MNNKAHVVEVTRAVARKIEKTSVQFKDEEMARAFSWWALKRGYRLKYEEKYTTHQGPAEEQRAVILLQEWLSS